MIGRDGEQWMRYAGTLPGRRRVDDATEGLKVPIKRLAAWPPFTLPGRPESALDAPPLWLTACGPHPKGDGLVERTAQACMERLQRASDDAIFGGCVR